MCVTSAAVCMGIRILKLMQVELLHRLTAFICYYLLPERHMVCQCPEGG